jgi:translation initiation factor IF-3
MVPVMQKKLARFVLNGNIETRWVQAKTEDGKLSPPQMLETLLRKIDQSAHAVRQLSATGPSPDTSIVEVVAIQDLMKVAGEKEKATREIEKQKKDQRPKQMEVNWAISENDLGLKLKQMEQFLEKGKKVEIMLAAKKRQRKATPEEGEAVLKKLREKIDEIGAKEVSKMQGKLLGQAILSVKKDG